MLTFQSFGNSSVEMMQQDVLSPQVNAPVALLDYSKALLAENQICNSSMNPPVDSSSIKFPEVWQTEQAVPFFANEAFYPGLLGSADYAPLVSEWYGNPEYRLNRMLSDYERGLWYASSSWGARRISKNELIGSPLAMDLFVPSSASFCSSSVWGEEGEEEEEGRRRLRSWK